MFLQSQVLPASHTPMFTVPHIVQVPLHYKYIASLFLTPVFPVSKSGLNQPCGSGDGCKDPKAMCVGSYCQCQRDYYEKDGFCGMNQWLLIFYQILHCLDVRV